LRHRSRNGSGNYEFKLFAGHDDCPSIVLRRISEAHGERMVRDRKARHVINGEGKMVGYQMFESALKPEPVMEPSSQASSTAFSRAELDAIAGAHFKGGENLAGEYGHPGRSRTAGMSEEKRMKRMAAGLRPVDLVEAAQAKLAHYQTTH
jgi:hypothetical protein